MENKPYKLNGVQYQILEFLGLGGFGMTFKAKNLSNNSLCAIKFNYPFSWSKDAISKEKSFRSHFLEVFQGCQKHILCYQEIVDISPGSPDYNRIFNMMRNELLIKGSDQSLNNLKKKIYDESLKNWSPSYAITVIISDYISGTDLETIVISNKRLGDESASILALQMIDVLDKLHSNRFYHRDIKPANIMMKDWKNFVMIDLGLSCFVSDGKDTNPCTSGAGSRHYQSPELLTAFATASESIDENIVRGSDNYALGMTILESVYGFKKEKIDRKDKIQRPIDIVIFLLLVHYREPTDKLNKYIKKFLSDN